MKKKFERFGQVVLSSRQLQSGSFYVVERMRKAVKYAKMKNARAKRAKLFVTFKYANLWRCCRGCESSTLDVLALDLVDDVFALRCSCYLQINCLLFFGSAAVAIPKSSMNFSVDDPLDGKNFPEILTDNCGSPYWDQ